MTDVLATWGIGRQLKPPPSAAPWAWSFGNSHSFWRGVENGYRRGSDAVGRIRDDDDRRCPAFRRLWTPLLRYV